MSSSFDVGENSTLQSAPSFSIYTSEDGFDGESEKLERVERETLEWHVMIGERNEEMGSGDFCFGNKGVDLIEENGEEEEVLSEFQDLGIDERVEPVSPRMYLATGLGIGGDGSGGGGAGGGGFAPEWFGGCGDVEEYYKRMVGEDPSSNHLFLRNYAQLLLVGFSSFLLDSIVMFVFIMHLHNGSSSFLSVYGYLVVTRIITALLNHVHVFNIMIIKFSFAHKKRMTFMFSRFLKLPFISSDKVSVLYYNRS